MAGTGLKSVDLVRRMRWPLRLAPRGVSVAKAGPHFREAEFTCDGREVCVHLAMCAASFTLANCQIVERATESRKEQ